MKKIIRFIAAAAAVSVLSLCVHAITIFESRYIGGVEYKMLTDISRYEEPYQSENRFLDTDINNIVKIYHDDDLWSNLRQSNSPETAAQLSPAYYTAKDGSFGKSEFSITGGSVKVAFDGFSSESGTDESLKSIFTANDYEASDGTKYRINDIYYFKGKNGAAVISYYTTNGVFNDLFTGDGEDDKVFKSLTVDQLTYLSTLEKEYSSEDPDGNFYDTLKADGFEIPENPEYTLVADDPEGGTNTDLVSSAYYDAPDNSAMLAIYMMLFLIGAAGISALIVVIKDKLKSDKSKRIMKK